jgi:hypothetical protein
MDEPLAQELAAMGAEDQKVRREIAKSPCGGARLSTSESMRWRRVDVANTDRLREILAEHGWPGESLVGKDSARYA